MSGGASYGGDATYDSSTDNSGSYDTGTTTDYGSSTSDTEGTSTDYGSSTSDGTRTDDLLKSTVKGTTDKSSPINIDKILKAAPKIISTAQKIKKIIDGPKPKPTKRLVVKKTIRPKPIKRAKPTKRPKPTKSNKTKSNRKPHHLRA